MKRRILLTRISALALAAAVAASVALPAAAEAAGDGVTPTCDEAYYATLDYYGNLVEGSVVKSYALNGKDSLTDYGVYDEVVNLTDHTEPSVGGGKTSFRFGGGAPDHFYFEGKTKKPFEDLPWRIAIRYTLNGVPAKAEDLAGQRGVVEILLDIVPNERAGDYARYNYTLAATALFNQDDILSLEAPGAQVQLVGNLRTVLFLCLPGEEQHFTIRVGSDDFSFGGLTVLMVPATLAQLEEIAKLSQRKDDLEEDYEALSGSLDNLLDALSDIQSGLYASASGLDQLNKARGTFSAGKGTLYDGADRLRGDLSSIAELLEPVEQRVRLLSATVTDSKAVLNEMADATVDLRDQLEKLEKALRGLQSGVYDLQDVIGTAADMRSSLLRLEHALGGSHVSTNKVSTNSRELVEKVKRVHGVYDADTSDEFMAGMLALQGKSEEEIKGIQTLLGIDETAAAAIGKQQEWQAAQAAKGQMDTVHTAIQGDQMSFQKFCENVLKVPSNQAKQMNDLWLIYDSGDTNKDSASGASDTPSGQSCAPAAEGTSVGMQAPEAEAPVPQEEEVPVEEAPAVIASDAAAEEESETQEAAESAAAGETLGKAKRTGKQVLTANSVQYEENGSDDSTGGASPDGGTTNDTPAGPPADGATGSPSGSGTADSATGDPTNSDTTGNTTTENNTVGGAVVDIITEGLDSASAQIDAIQAELVSSLNSIKRPTATVVGELADLCGELDDLVDTLDDAEDLMAALRKSSGTLREILEDVDDLRAVLNGYEPTLQEALANAGTLSTSAVTAIRDTEALLADAESLARSTGGDLDAGTKQSLNGLAAALRQTTKALAATDDVRGAKKTITNIIEDTWDEYTGDVNNILMMDATAEPISLTDSRNPAPDSIQVLIRTQEIKAEEPEEAEEAAAVKEKTTFWGRVARMFRDFWNAVTGIFH